MLLNQGEAAPVVPTIETVPATPVEPTPAPVEVKEEVKEQVEDPKFASKFAALSRKEQSLRLKEQTLKHQEADYKAYKEEQKLLNDNPLEYLNKKGLTFDKLTQLALNDGKKPAEMQVQELREQLEREKLEREESEKTAAQKSYEVQKVSFVNEIKDFIESNKESYELVSVADEPSELIYNVIEQHYLNTKRVLPVKEAVEMVEKHFESELESKYSKLNKFKSKFGAKEPVEVKTETVKQSPTLTNSQAAAVATPHTQKVMSVDESKREAAKLLKWV